MIRVNGPVERQELSVVSVTYLFIVRWRNKVTIVLGKCTNKRCAHLKTSHTWKVINKTWNIGTWTARQGECLAPMNWSSLPSAHCWTNNLSGRRFRTSFSITPSSTLRTRSWPQGSQSWMKMEKGKTMPWRATVCCKRVSVNNQWDSPIVSCLSICYCGLAMAWLAPWVVSGSVCLTNLWPGAQWEDLTNAVLWANTTRLITFYRQFSLWH